MTPFDTNLDDEQQLILDVLLSCPTKDDAAKALGISRATLYRRIQDIEIQEALAEVRRTALHDVTGSLHRLANDAAITLSVIMNAKEAPFSARVAAASKLLDLAYRSFELQEISEEIQALKKDLAL
jgi:AcrR family transcriptional regulator